MATTPGKTTGAAATTTLAAIAFRIYGVPFSCPARVSPADAEAFESAAAAAFVSYSQETLDAIQVAGMHATFVCGGAAALPHVALALFLGKSVSPANAEAIPQAIRATLAARATSLPFQGREHPVIERVLDVAETVVPSPFHGCVVWQRGSFRRCHSAETGAGGGAGASDRVPAAAPAPSTAAVRVPGTSSRTPTTSGHAPPLSTLSVAVYGLEFACPVRREARQEFEQFAAAVLVACAGKTLESWQVVGTEAAFVCAGTPHTRLALHLDESVAPAGARAAADAIIATLRAKVTFLPLAGRMQRVAGAAVQAVGTHAFRSLQGADGPPEGAEGAAAAAAAAAAAGPPSLAAQPDDADADASSATQAGCEAAGHRWIKRKQKCKVG